MKIRSTLTLLFIAFTISSLFFLPNFSHAEPDEKDKKIQELEEKIEVLTKQVKTNTGNIQTNTENIQTNTENIDALEDDQKKEDDQDVTDAVENAVNTGASNIPGSNIVLTATATQKAIGAVKNYQDKYGENPSVLGGGTISSENCGPGPVYHQHQTGEGNEPGQYEVDDSGRKNYH